MAKRCILEQKLLLTPIGSRIGKSIGTKINDLDPSLFRGRMKVMSSIALHSTLNISETVRDRGLVSKDYQEEMAYVLSNGHLTYDIT